jgi:hypothetical protein
MTDQQQQTDPQDCPDVDLVWLDLTEDNAHACVAETVERARRYRANPKDPIGMPGSMVTVAVMDLPTAVVAGVFALPYSILRVALCVHGELPPMDIDGPVAAGRRWEYCKECAVYMLSTDIGSHRPNAYIRAIG